MGASLAAKLNTQLEARREHGTKPRDLSVYVGRYWNEPKTFHINISLHEEGLRMAFQSIDNETYKMRHYHHDVFIWNLSHNEMLAKADFKRAR
ncbi:beta-lactamase family [Paramyrothecium foliicola]|nr:beta-lactamase family [Paramyrothecium foliicola]